MCDKEEAELRRLEQGAVGTLTIVEGAHGQNAAGGVVAQNNSMPPAASVQSGGALAAASVGSGVLARVERQDIVQSASKKQEQLESKKLFQPAARISGLMPRGGSGLKGPAHALSCFGAQSTVLSAPLLLPLPAAKLLPRSQRRPWRALGYVARADAEGWLTRVTFSSAVGAADRCFDKATAAA